MRLNVSDNYNQFADGPGKPTSGISSARNASVSASGSESNSADVPPISKHMPDLYSHVEALPKDARIDTLERLLPDTGWEKGIQDSLLVFTRQAITTSLANSTDNSMQWGDMITALEYSRARVTFQEEREALEHLLQSLIYIMQSSNWSTSERKKPLQIEESVNRKLRQKEMFQQVQSVLPAGAEASEEVSQERGAIERALDELEQALDASNSVEKETKRESLRILCGILIIPIRQIGTQIDGTDNAIE